MGDAPQQALKAFGFANHHLIMLFRTAIGPGGQSANNASTSPEDEIIGSSHLIAESSANPPLGDYSYRGSSYRGSSRPFVEVRPRYSGTSPWATARRETMSIFATWASETDIDWRTAPWPAGAATGRPAGGARSGASAQRTTFTAITAPTPRWQGLAAAQRTDRKSVEEELQGLRQAARSARTTYSRAAIWRDYTMFCVERAVPTLPLTFTKAALFLWLRCADQGNAVSFGRWQTHLLHAATDRGDAPLSEEARSELRATRGECQRAVTVTRKETETISSADIATIQRELQLLPCPRHKYQYSVLAQLSISQALCMRPNEHAAEKPWQDDHARRVIRPCDITVRAHGHVTPEGIEMPWGGLLAHIREPKGDKLSGRTGGDKRPATGTGQPTCPVRMYLGYLELHGLSPDSTEPLFAKLDKEGNRERPVRPVSQKEYNRDLRDLLGAAGLSTTPSARGVRASGATEELSKAMRTALQQAQARGSWRSQAVMARHYVRHEEGHGYNLRDIASRGAK